MFEKNTSCKCSFLPPITTPPTEMCVINAAVYRSIDIVNELRTNYIFLEVDQAIYHKVLDAMFKMEHEVFLMP